MLMLLLVAFPAIVRCQNTDLFNYDTTRSWDGGMDYGPREWDQVECDDIEECYGWPEKFHMGVGWSLRRNDCQNCEPGDGCGTHHQSPVPLDRQWGARKRMGDTGVMNCGDNHWMKYEGGTCNWEHLRAANAVTVERHALRISQPVVKEDNSYKLDCYVPGRGRIFSRMDMSGGFSQWWFLNHIDIHTPSEHTQNGKRYAGEVHLGYYYSVPSGADNGSNNRMLTVGVFLDERNETMNYPFLDKLICEWRRTEENVRKECGLPSVTSKYPGCFPYDRTEATSPFRAGERRLNETSSKPRLRRSPIDFNASPEEQEVRLNIDPRNYRPAERTEEEWAKFQEEYSRQHPLNSTNPFSTGRRHLMDFDHVPYDNFQFLTDCRTEYYFRYEGTMTYPPCFTESNSERVNVWRFMKDPIRVHPRQIKELHRLLRERIAPLGSYDGSPKECTPDTAAKVMDDGTAWVARPLQELDESGPGSSGHDNFFCECDDWGSKIPEEQEWCRQYRNDDEIRWVTNPYNFGGFAGV
jgi:hypothetical protein